MVLVPHSRRLNWRLAIAGAAVLLAGWTAVWTLAAISDAHSRSLLYEDEAETGRALDLAGAARIADLAIALNPLEANYRRTRAQVAGAGAHPANAGQTPDAADAERAAQAYEEVVARRPIWGMGWAELATARQAAGEPPELVLASLRRAIYFAPHEPLVRRTALQLGATLRDALAPQDRQTILWVATYTLQHDVRMLREMARDPDVAAFLRALVAGTEHAAALDSALPRGR
jgi:hypothetical protein